MSGAYFRDLGIKKVGDRTEGSKKTYKETHEILQLITPEGLNVLREHSVKLGHIVEYAFEEDVNFIFNPRNIEILKSKNLTAELTNKTAKNRAIWLPNIPEHVFNKDIPTLTEALVQATKSRLLHVKKYASLSGRKYLILTAASKTSRDAILALKSLNLFGSCVNVEQVLEKPRYGYYQNHERQPSPRHEPHPRHAPATSVHPAWGAGYQGDLPCPTFRPPPPALHHDREFPGLPMGTPFPWENKPRTTSTGNPHLQENNSITPNHVFKNEHDMKFYIDTSMNLCLKLSVGIEKPEEYVSVLNEMYSNKGLPTIDVPNHYLITSRNKFLQEKSILFDPLSPPSQSLPNNTTSLTSTLSSTSSTPVTSPTLASSLTSTSSLTLSPTPPSQTSQNNHIQKSPLTSTPPKHRPPPLSIPNTPFTSQSTPILTLPITLCGPSSIPASNTSTSQTTHAISPRSLATSAPTTLTSHIHTSPIVSSSTVPIVNPSSTKSPTRPSSPIPSTTQIHHHSPSTTSSNLFFPQSPNPANISPSRQSPSSCQPPSSSPPPTPAKTRLATLKSLTISDKNQNGL